MLTSLRQGSQLDQLIRRTKILVNEPRLDAWLTRVLITELLWGKKRLSSECKPVKTVLNYENILREELNSIKEFESPGNELKRGIKQFYHFKIILISFFFLVRIHFQSIRFD